MRCHVGRLGALAKGRIHLLHDLVVHLILFLLGAMAVAAVVGGVVGMVVPLVGVNLELQTKTIL